MADLSVSKYATWAVRGLGGAVNILGDLLGTGHAIDDGNLLELRRAVLALVSIYNTHAAASGLEPHERPLISTQPVSTAAPAAAETGGGNASPANPTGQSDSWAGLRAGCHF